MKKTVLGSLLLLLASISTLLAAPPQPAISAAGGGQVSLSWTSTNGVLQMAPDLGSLPFSWMNVAASPTVSGGTNTVLLAAANPVQFFHLINSSGLPPTRLTVDVQLDGTLLLNWDTVPGASAYNVYMAATPGVSPANYSSLPGGTLTDDVGGNTLSVSGLTPGTTYYFVATALSADGESAPSNQGSGIYGLHAGVEGTVSTPISSSGYPVNMPVPGVTLTLINTATGLTNASLVSDVNGEFTFPDQPEGTYQLCWSAPGFVSGCLSSTLMISNLAVDVDSVMILPATNSTTGVVYGNVTFQNGVPALYNEIAYGVDVLPAVILAVGTNRLGAVVNSSAQYIITRVPLTNSALLAGTLEKALVTTNLNTTTTGEADLVFSNSPPVIESVIATLNNTPVYRVPPGSTVLATASAASPDGSPLEYQWFSEDGPLIGETESNISWTLPSVGAGFEYLWVLVSDGYGGYADARVTVDLVDLITFSGTVLDDSTSQPLTNAVVTVNGVAAFPDANGFFSVLVPPASQYLLEISCPGYWGEFKTYPDQVTDEPYRLVPISTNPCGNSALVTTIVTNAWGAALEIAANTLVDAADEPYTSNYSVSLDSDDPCDACSSFPGGNFTAGQGLLNAFGFVNIAVRDCEGNPLYLTEGATANLFLPTGTNCLGGNTNPPVAQFYTLGKNTNVWNIIGLATNTSNPAVGFIGNILSFGPVASAVPAPPGALFISADRTLHVPFTIGIFQTNGTSLIQYQDIFYQTAQSGTNVSGQVVNGLPAGPVLIKILNLRQSPGEFYNQGVPVLRPNKTIIQAISATVTSGATNTVIAGLGIGPGRAAQISQLTVAEVNALTFLARRAPASTNLSVTANDPNAVFNQYYTLIDPLNQKTNFARWQILNGWSTNNAGVNNFTGPNAGVNDDAFGLYFNASDLGAGRRTGMKTNGNWVAYYVATYASLADAEVATNLKYVVCMEYSPHPKMETNNGYIKFYAFGPDGARGGVVKDEDRHHQTYVPYVCMDCHGAGEYTPAPTLGMTTNTNSAAVLKGNVGGQFIGFDLAGYTFSQAGGFTRSNLVANNSFTKMNQGTLKSLPIMPPPLTNYINALLVGNQNYTVAPPSAWGAGVTNTSLYNNVYAVDCRSCHITQLADRWPTAESFVEESGNFSYGSDPKQTMPQPQRTYSIFWGSATAWKLTNSVVNAPQLLSGQPVQFQLP